MDSREHVRRRTVLGLAGAVGFGALAGCLSGAGYDEELYEGETLVEDEPDYGNYLNDVDHPGTVDWTGEDDVTVFVGTGGGGLDFGPAAIQIDRGTTVTWEWTGNGGGHDVVDTDGAFESEQARERGHTFEHTFDEPGTYTYSCVPHETQAMKGAVDVV